MGMKGELDYMHTDPTILSFSAPRSRRPPGIRLIVSGVSRDTSWQV
jgi:hypothetical protein